MSTSSTPGSSEAVHSRVADLLATAEEVFKPHRAKFDAVISVISQAHGFSPDQLTLAGKTRCLMTAKNECVMLAIEFLSPLLPRVIIGFWLNLSRTTVLRRIAEVKIRAETCADYAEWLNTLRGRIREALTSLEGKQPGKTSAQAADGDIEPGVSVGTSDPVYYRASYISAVVGVGSKTVHRRAAEQGWPARCEGNRVEYVPPFRMPSAAALAFRKLARKRGLIEFKSSAATESSQRRALAREKVVQFFNARIRAECSAGDAVMATMRHFAQLEEPFIFRARALYKWRSDYEALGINGLMDQRAGHSGRPRKRSGDSGT